MLPLFREFRPSTGYFRRSLDHKPGCCCRHRFVEFRSAARSSTVVSRTFGCYCFAGFRGSIQGYFAEFWPRLRCYNRWFAGLCCHRRHFADFGPKFRRQLVPVSRTSGRNFTVVITAISPILYRYFAVVSTRFRCELVGILLLVRRCVPRFVANFGAVSQI